MFGKKKRKRSQWFSTLLEVEQLFKEGYLITSTSGSYVWFNREIDNVLSTVGVKRRFFDDGSGCSLEVIEDYRKHHRRLSVLEMQNHSQHHKSVMHVNV